MPTETLTTWRFTDRPYQEDSAEELFFTLPNKHQEYVSPLKAFREGGGYFGTQMQLEIIRGTSGTVGANTRQLPAHRVVQRSVVRELGEQEVWDSIELYLRNNLEDLRNRPGYLVESVTANRCAGHWKIANDAARKKLHDILSEAYSPSALALTRAQRMDMIIENPRPKDIVSYREGGALFLSEILDYYYADKRYPCKECYQEGRYGGLESSAQRWSVVSKEARPSGRPYTFENREDVLLCLQGLVGPLMETFHAAFKQPRYAPWPRLHADRCPRIWVELNDAFTEALCPPFVTAPDA